MRQYLGSKKPRSVFSVLQNHPEVFRQLFFKVEAF